MYVTEYLLGVSSSDQLVPMMGSLELVSAEGGAL